LIVQQALGLVDVPRDFDSRRLHHISDLAFVTATRTHSGVSIDIASVLVDTGAAITFIDADLAADASVYVSATDTLHHLRGVGGHAAFYAEAPVSPWRADQAGAGKALALPKRAQYTPAEVVLARIREMLARDTAAAWGVRTFWATLRPSSLTSSSRSTCSSSSNLRSWRIAATSSSSS
jgi:hypothetical protein